MVTFFVATGMILGVGASICISAAVGIGCIYLIDEFL